MSPCIEKINRTVSPTALMCFLIQLLTRLADESTWHLCLDGGCGGGDRCGRGDCKEKVPGVERGHRWRVCKTAWLQDCWSWWSWLPTSVKEVRCSYRTPTEWVFLKGDASCLQFSGLNECIYLVVLLEKSTAYDFLQKIREKRGLECFPGGCSTEIGEAEEQMDMNVQHVRERLNSQLQSKTNDLLELLFLCMSCWR